MRDQLRKTLEQADDIMLHHRQDADIAQTLYIRAQKR